MNEQFISSFDEACAKLGESPVLPDLTGWPERLHQHLHAFFKLEKIIRVNNGAWVADIANTGQLKYYPWFDVIVDASAPAGFRLSYYGFDDDFSISRLGARLACKSKELAKFMGENHADLYAELHA